MNHWESLIEECVQSEMTLSCHDDGSHDFGHLRRVSRSALQFAREEHAHELVVFAAGMLHDIVSLPKNHPESNKSSLYASERAKELLFEIDFPSDLILDVCHAIHAHSFSAQIEPRTAEAKCVQDADRMEALGALGLMRLFYVSGKIGSCIIHDEDPDALNRPLDDKKFAIDHIPLKLLTLMNTMKTRSGRQMAESLSNYVANFRNDMISDQRQGHLQSGRFIIAQTYYQAGQENLQLFHPTDPFLYSDRSCEPFKYALDRLLTRNEDGIISFINQLSVELNGAIVMMI